jgi:hypothetical protein
VGPGGGVSGGGVPVAGAGADVGGAGSSYSGGGMYGRALAQPALPAIARPAAMAVVIRPRRPPEIERTAVRRLPAQLSHMG